MRNRTRNQLGLAPIRIPTRAPAGLEAGTAHLGHLASGPRPLRSAGRVPGGGGGAAHPVLDVGQSPMNPAGRAPRRPGAVTVTAHRLRAWRPVWRWSPRRRRTVRRRGPPRAGRSPPGAAPGAGRSGTRPSTTAELRPWRCGLPAPVAPLTNAARQARATSVPSPPGDGGGVQRRRERRVLERRGERAGGVGRDVLHGVAAGEPVGPLYLTAVRCGRSRRPCRPRGGDVDPAPPTRRARSGAR